MFLTNLFTGRMNRQNYIVGYLSLVGIILLLYSLNPNLVVHTTFQTNPTLYIFLQILSLVSTFFYISLCVRRFHDRNQNGWWTIIVLLVPLLTLYLLIAKGDTGNNKYGDQPKARFSLQDILGNESKPASTV